MAASPFAFFRGAAAVMAADLAGGPGTGLVVQLCGDAHLSNFGVFAAPDRRLVFDCNDFDETCPGLLPSPYEHHGRRVVEGQGLMQAASDVFLGWVTATGIDGKERCFYVRQLWDGKGSADVERMAPPDLAAYGALCGRTLARAHGRSGDRIAIASYLGSGEAFDEAIAAFAEAYADQNERDFERLVAAGGRDQPG